MKKLFRILVCVLPAVLYFSYYPLIHFGESESMNFEISLPLIWLVLFDLTVMMLIARKRDFWRGILKYWMWLLLPVWLSLTVIWSQNVVRGLLTAGIMWLLYFAVYGFYYLKDLFDAHLRKKFWKIFLVSTVVVCGWCLVQCVLDLVGVGREYSLMCNGCTYTMFGFPHPNGFAIEPQFMGNLLLAPAIIIVWMLFKNYSGSDFLSFKLLLICFLVVISTLFLTFSRGAIYAFTVALIFVSVFIIVKNKKKQTSKTAVRSVGIVWGLTIFSFLLSLNLQGIMAAVSPTNDTYVTGVTKVLNHLSLGIIDVRDKKSEEMQALESEITEEESDGGEILIVEKPVENLVENRDENAAVFDGYVAESTETRLRLSGVAIGVWQGDFTTMMFGVGLGGAGQALYKADLSPSPKEIVQNQYVSLLLETGILGIILLIFTVGLILRALIKMEDGVMIIALVIAYGVSLCFFAGLPNALHVYLLPVTMVVLMTKKNRQ